MQARVLPAIRGAYWLVGGLFIYRRNPPLLSMLTLSYMMLGVAFTLLKPIGPFLLPLLLPMVTTLIANSCRAIEKGWPVPPGALVAGLVEQRRKLLQLGVLQLLGTLIILVLDQVLPGGDLNALNGAKDQAAVDKIDASELILPLLRITLIGLPVALAFWFAPLLTAWHGVPAAKSLFFSLVAVWRNWRAFLVYAMTAILVGVLTPGLILIVISLVSGELVKILSTALEMILLLIFAPVMMTVTYQGYCDIFAPEIAADQAPDSGAGEGGGSEGESGGPHD